MSNLSWAHPRPWEFLKQQGGEEKQLGTQTRPGFFFFFFLFAKVIKNWECKSSLEKTFQRGDEGGEKSQGKQDSFYLPPTSSPCAREDNSSRRKQSLPWNLARLSSLVTGREGETACASEASLPALNLINRDCAMQFLFSLSSSNF